MDAIWWKRALIAARVKSPAACCGGFDFTINRARQYRKTTLLNALARYLADEYLVVGMDFQAIGNGKRHVWKFG